MDRHEIAYALEKFAEDAGFEPDQPFYIRGQFLVRAAQGISLYSDEAHLYCEECANDLWQKAFPFFSDEERKEIEVWASDSSYPVDSPSACDTCRKTLRHCLSDRTGVDDELAHYDENPIELGEIISPDMAYCIAQIVASAYGDDDVRAAIAVGESALAAIEFARANKTEPSSEVAA